MTNAVQVIEPAQPFHLAVTGPVVAHRRRGARGGGAKSDAGRITQRFDLGKARYPRAVLRMGPLSTSAVIVHPSTCISPALRAPSSL